MGSWSTLTLHDHTTDRQHSTEAAQVSSKQQGPGACVVAILNPRVCNHQQRSHTLATMLAADTMGYRASAFGHTVKARPGNALLSLAR
jgi:hypothetical protein